MAGTDGERRERVRGAVLGLAVGDAVGTTVEFQAPGSFAPVVDLVGGGVFELPAGAFTDDTSMALCLAESLVELGAFDLLDQLERYVRWWRGGHLSSTGTCFDIGATTRMALAGFAETGAPSPETSPTRAGNGSLMRLAPAALAGATLEDAIALAGRSSLSTHAAPQAIDACRLFGAMLWAAADGAPREAVLDPAFWRFGALHPEVEAVARGSYHDAEPPRISGAGYVVGSLEAALWALARGDGYADAVLRAVNLGDDADTTGAICGQLAGALAGEAGIPTAWRERLVLRSTIEALADGVAALALAAPWAVPWPETYWAVPGAVLAGEHPARGGPASAPARLAALLDHGVGVVIDLTEPDELPAYADELRALARARGRGVEVVRLPIADMGVPSGATMRAILDAIAAAGAAGTTAFVHCHAGRGRTGTAIGCLLAERGEADPLAALGVLRADLASAARPSPETPAQAALVQAWPRA